MATPHNSAALGDFAKTVLMPGDPLRAKFIAENFLENVRLVNNVRGINGYTGTYQGVPVSVMASGMGIPSIGIYSYELYTEYGVENIMRIGSAGAMSEDVHVRDIVIGMGACTNSHFGDQYKLSGTFAPIASYTMMRAAGLYMTAARLHKNALAICTISDSLITGEALPALERQNTFTQMMEIALRTAVKLNG